MKPADLDPLWCVMPIAGGEQYTDAAISDVLAQTVPTRVLLVLQGVSRQFRTHLERVSEADPARIYVWCYDPALPSLSAAWNRALDFCWETGAEEALVVNNDVRLHRETAYWLQQVRFERDALFVSAVGVTEDQFNPAFVFGPDFWSRMGKGGPDFSCFLLSKEGHTQYRFDEGFRPAYCEDLDTHRRYLLGGDGDRIFSINLPYLHYASGTLKGMDPDRRRALEVQIDQSRAYYAEKWGGPVNVERYTIPFDAASAQDGVTTPELQAGAHGVQDASAF